MMKNEKVESKNLKEEKKEEKDSSKGVTPEESTENENAAEEATVEDKKNEEDKLNDEEISKSQEKKDDDESQRYIRLMADFQNYKNRVEKQKSEIYAFANEKLISKFLDIIDNFERALSGECSDEAFKSGVDMIFNQFMAVLRESGLAEIEAKDQQFDPNVHNGVMTEEVEGVEEGIVTDVLQKGYKLNDKVIRAAMVKVSK